MTSISPDPWLTGGAGHTPEILHDLPGDRSLPPGVTLRQVVLRHPCGGEVFAAIATPPGPGPHPGLLVLHGGGGIAEVEKALAWAERGYLAVAPDLPGIAEPSRLTHTQGRWNALTYGEGRWTATPDPRASVIFDAVVAAVQALGLLRAQPGIDRQRIGVTGISWGGYMTTMVSALAGSQVRAAFSVFGCGFYEHTVSARHLAAMAPDEQAAWLACLDPGRRASAIQAPVFLAAATNDFFFFPRAVQATLDALPGEQHHLFAANADHQAPVPGGMDPTPAPPAGFAATSTQRLPTPLGSRGHWLAMEMPWFDWHLRGEGQPFPMVQAESPALGGVAVVEVASPRPVIDVTFHAAAEAADPTQRRWEALPAVALGAGRWHARLPDAATTWFASVSDDRPVTVSTDLQER